MGLNSHHYKQENLKRINNVIIDPTLRLFQVYSTAPVKSSDTCIHSFEWVSVTGSVSV